MSGSKENEDSEKASIVGALAEFMETFPSVPMEQKRIMKTVLSPCFDFWFKARDKMTKSLLELAEEADEIYDGYGDVVKGADIASLGGKCGGIAAMALGATPWTLPIQVVGHVAGAVSAGAKAAEMVETRRIHDQVDRALRQDATESRALEKLVNQYFIRDREKEQQAVKALVEPARKGVFNSVVQQTTLKHLTSTYENYTADKATSAHMLSACFEVLKELEIKEFVDKSTQQKIAQFLHVNRVVVDVTLMCTRELGEIIAQCYLEAFVLPTIPAFLGIGLQTLITGYKIKRMFEYGSRPRLSREIRAIVADLDRVRDMLRLISDAIRTA